MTKTKISAIIPTFNSWKTIKVCIESLNNQSLPLQDIIVVDNASTDNTSRNVKKYFPKIKLITLKENTGVTGGRNTGIQSASKSTDYIFFFDHDMIAHKNMIRNLVKVAEKSKKIGIVTPKIYYKSDKNRIWSAGTGINLRTGQTIFRGGSDVGQYDKDLEVQVAPAALLVRREVIDKIHGFDPKYFATYEDTDFCFRARKHGFRTMYAHEAIAWHDLTTDPDKEAKRLLSRSYYVSKNRILFMWDYGNVRTFIFFIPIFFLYYLRLSLKYRDWRNILNYINGQLVGIVQVTKLNAKIPFSYCWEVSRLLRKCETILDIGCGEGKFTESVITDDRVKVTGIELFENSINRAKYRKIYNKFYIMDVLNVSHEHLDKRQYDIVFCSQVVEHLTKKSALMAIKNWEKLAKKRTVITTTVGMIDYCPIEETDIETNPLQEHKSGWSVSEFVNMGYKVVGQGSKHVYGNMGLMRKYPKYSPIWELFGLLIAPYYYFNPSRSMYLIAYKDK